MLADDAHPAISHFAPEVQDEIRRELGSASVRRVGEIMIGKTPAPNAVYNAAANVVTAVLGGPERLTAAIHRRDAAFRTVHVRRYMLRDRTQPGDNEATATALAHLYRQLATHRLPGVDEPTVTAIRDVLWRPNDSPSGPHYAKFGRLRSDPLTEVRAGWQERPNGTVIYVVMLAQTGPGGRDRQAASQTLSQTAQKLATALLEAASQARTGIDE